MGSSADPGWLGVLVALVATVAAAVPDIRERRIPNAIVVAGLLVIVVLAIGGGRWVDALAGGALGVALVALPRLAGPAAVGGGDIKLAAVVGSGLGVPGVVVVIGLAVAVATPVVAVRALRRGEARDRTLPFAPYLALGVVGYAAVVLAVGVE